MSLARLQDTRSIKKKSIAFLHTNNIWSEMKISKKQYHLQQNQEVLKDKSNKRCERHTLKAIIHHFKKPRKPK